MSDQNWTESIVSEDATSAVVGTPSNPTQVNETVQEDETTSVEATENSEVIESDVVESTEEVAEEELSQREQLKGLVKRERELRANESKAAEAQAQIDEYNTLKASVKENPAAVLEHLGISFDDLLSAQLGIEAEKPEPLSEMEELREEIKALKEAKEQESADAQQAQIDAVISAHKSEIETLLNTEKDSYELINATGEHELVWEVTEQYYETNGEVLAPAAAAKLVEDHLMEKYGSVFEKTSKFKKTPEVQAEAEKPVEPKQSEVTVSEALAETKSSKVTLTNNGGTATKAKNKKKIDAEASKAHAASLIKWT